MKLKTTVALALTGILISGGASANQLWSNFSVSYLKGSDYEVGDNKRQVVTFEHASGHSWGDTFLFIDRSVSDDSTRETYFEFGPRVSLNYLTGLDLSVGPVKDVLLAGQWEGKSDKFGGFDNFLFGVGMKLDVPGFSYVNANVYHVNNGNKDSDEQLSVSFAAPFSVGSAEFLYDGFIDWSTSASDHASEMNFTSQLKWNAGKLLGSKAPVYVGVEYAYWNNKFGINGVDERNPSLLLKWHF
ncbi:outer membrane protein OmpK [Neptunomonas antarctica]|uniref:Nucleoside-specific outer membrane channel protein Tsx n=1 Tax=Neptunomonas antarctica TaxID=619304 RepID=A0A1N7L8X4_9GAMM|nr:outer membrane protein OmpK [Neptunomonas antarctica]SIS70312.1 Nucleoside-specific outer membrane channel protein Tsx [Neptunomonas antarctica]